MLTLLPPSVIDQRATSTHEGIAIAHATSEALIQGRVPTIFATHFVQLASTLSPYPNLKSNHLLVSLAREAEGTQSFSFQHKIASGVCNEEHYGIVLARGCQLPTDLLEEADKIARSLQESSRLAQNESVGARAATRRVMIRQLEMDLKSVLQSDQIGTTSLWQIMSAIQHNFMRRLDESLPTTMQQDCPEDGEDEEMEESTLDLKEFRFDHRNRETR
jgi:DNA mismatch repair protein MSH4